MAGKLARIQQSIADNIIIIMSFKDEILCFHASIPCFCFSSTLLVAPRVCLIARVHRGLTMHMSAAELKITHAHITDYNTVEFCRLENHKTCFTILSLVPL